MTSELTCDRKKEGWTWLWNARRYHYFREGRALCGHYLLFRNPSEGYDDDIGEHSENCKACFKKREKELKKSNPATSGASTIQTLASERTVE